ncbi:DUF2029 domain-containing protein [Nocardia terpenica]|uniref:glycosyltransferase 87 family protein n=1 Tax=Nocardia terpenica TaxID=455432 RepID=UPI00189567CB|nr:glycosyltransferase 87 family protein [Nocardia terpenica]MBF6065934.1 DUF2029 domain-containing protein [Nocardia terpenica]MBF6108870.1 DUF2029 domain-containing protein [Nocardia terpenica]MBF6116178.1 DUF2029 domain-containing protein [Nocardia terpenica]MBF6123179.1 DUF2029 domain-containing protein [Nocardia terpenica]MBF6153139.1 DUF2029 domain-containing protein [Nocardia terpenica]
MVLSSTIADPAAAPAERISPQRRTVGPVAFWTILVLGAVAGGYYVHQVLDQLEVLLHLKDLSVYQIAGNRVLDGISVYDTPLLGNTRGVWEFVYTPFAALLFVPLAALRGDVFTVVGAVGNAAMLAASVWAALSLLGFRRDVRLAVLTLPISGLLMWCEPIRETMAFGQVNILLLLLVLADMALPDSSRWKGALTGIAAGIKLTPALFIVYLLITRRYRAMWTAIGSLAATMILGFAVLPKDSATFWSGAFADPARVGVPQNPGNESLRGMVARTIGVGGAHQVLWLASVLVVAAACLLVARQLSLTGRELPAVVLCGLATTTVSPYSWVHHWVWLAPLLIYLTDLTCRRRSVGTALGLGVAAVVSSGGVLALIDPPTASILGYPSWGGMGVFYHNAYIWLTLALVAAGGVEYTRRRVPAKSMPGPWAGG